MCAFYPGASIYFIYIPITYTYPIRNIILILDLCGMYNLTKKIIV